MTIIQPNLEISVLTNKITAAPSLPHYAPEHNSAPLFRGIIGNLLDHLESVPPASSDEAKNGHQPLSAKLSSGELLSLVPQLPEQMKTQLLAETINALTAIGGHDNPPARHIVGHEAVATVKEKLKTVSEELEDFVEVSCAVDIEENSPTPQQAHEAGHSTRTVPKDFG